MKLNTKISMIVLIAIGISSIGFISYVQLQPTSAQSPGFLGLDNLPGYDTFKGLIGKDNSNKAVITSNADYLDIDKAVVGTAANKVQAVLQAHGHIPTNGNEGAFGYSILTTQGLNAIMVSTTHKGVLDSEDQRNANDPRWHNHYVSLAVNPTGPCGSNPSVTSITFQSPGEVLVSKDKAVMSNLPGKFTGTNALTNKPLTLNPGTNVENVVSFKLLPVFSTANQLQAVCVTDIHDADKVIKN